MPRIWEKIERYWNFNWTLAWVLAAGGILAALFAGFFPQPPGVSIGLLALVAGIMSVRPKMRPAEKFAWVAVLISFTILEIHAIQRSEQENFANLMNQNSQFRQTASDLFWANELNREGFGETMNAFSEINTEEQQRFYALVYQNDKLFQHEEKLAESLGGTLAPGDDPTPPNSCRDELVPPNSVRVFIGDVNLRNVNVVNTFPSVLVAREKIRTAFETSRTVPSTFFLGGYSPSRHDPVVSLDRSANGNVTIILDLRSRDNRVIAKMDKDGFVVNRNDILEVEKDKSHVRIVDEFGVEVLNIRYFNSRAIGVSGTNIGLQGASGVCIAEPGPIILPAF